MTIPQGGGTVRLLGGAPNLASHLNRHGPLPTLDGPTLIDAVERSGLTGRGGAGFPAGRKLRAVAQAAATGRRALRQRTAVVVANGCEGEPASGKDRVLITSAPHLVLDGIVLAARAVGADCAYLCLHEDDHAVLDAVRRALDERRAAGIEGSGSTDAAANGAGAATEGLEIRITPVPHRYVASQETSLLRLLNGGPALPLATPPRPFERGVGGRPTLVNNVETLAQLALIARHGPDWFRSVGTAEAPGTALVTLGGAVAAPGVYEIPLGISGEELIAGAGGATEALQAVLTGGYFGTWLPLAHFGRAGISAAGLSAAGGAMGAGVFLALPADRCGLAETARIAGYLAKESAEQCGPCLNGLPALARGLEALAFRADPRAPGYLDSVAPYLAGRGACHLPDGAVRLIGSAMTTFAADAAAHGAGRPCAGLSKSGRGQGPMFPIPYQAAASTSTVAAGAR